MMSLLHIQEKRSQRRLPAAELKAELKSKQGLFSSWLELDVVDFNLSGIALKLPSEPELGSKLNLRLILEMDAGEIKVNPLEVKVVNKVNTIGDGIWRVGVIFSSQTKQSPDTMKQLERIQQILERNAAITDRMTRKAG
jgi:hypothetical protein